MSAPLPRLTAQRREWLTEASTCRYPDLQVLLANYDAVPGLLESHARLLDAAKDAQRWLMGLAKSIGPASLLVIGESPRMQHIAAAIAAAEKLVSK
jgi:hypothetical protein